MKNFKHVNASESDDVVSLLAEFRGKAKVVAGGTDLLGAMKDNIHPVFPDLIISLGNISDLSYIKKEANGELKVGALTRLYDIETDTEVKQKYPALTEAAKAVASPHIREMGTLGGNICQGNRCWYYRYPDNRFNCIRKGGNECYALYGENQFHSIFGAARVNTLSCARECPANIDIPSYMELIRTGDFNAAAKIILNSNPIPAVTGRVCPQFCQNGCVRQFLDSAVSIRNVERFVGDYILDNEEEFFTPPKEDKKKSVVIVGSGPAALSAAYYIRQAGYKVTVLEQNGEIGGLLSYGIPPYRLPKSVVRNVVAALENTGIEFKINVEVGKNVAIEDLIEKNDAVFLACGAWVEKKMNMEGESLTLSSLDFLSKVNVGEIEIPGKKIAVIGGGNAAIDVARTLLRLGGEPTVIYRRSEEHMPAIKEEIIKAKEEGIHFNYLTLPVKASRKGNTIDLECVKMKLGAHDATGRPQPERIAGSEYTEQYDAVIKGIGQAIDTSFLPKNFLKNSDKLNVKPGTFLIGENVFAGGDFLTGPASVVEAVASGRKAAGEIEEFLGYKEDEPVNNGNNRQYGIFGGAYLGIAKEAVKAPELPIEERIKQIDTEDVEGLEPDKVKEEANRCFNCGCVAVSPSDMAPVIIALDAVVKTTKRSIKAEDFFKAGVMQSTILEPDEFVIELIFPESKPDIKQTYIKFALRKSIDFPIVGVAVCIKCNRKNEIEDARIVLGNVAPIPLRCKDSENYLKGKELCQETAEEAAKVAVKSAKALSKNGYKIKIVQTLVKRALQKVMN